MDQNDAVRSVWAFVRLSRPHFLVGGFLMFAVGAAATRRLDLFGYAIGQVVVTAGQVTAHYVNEFADVEPDKGVVHRTFFSGGSGVLTGGLLPVSVAIRAALVSTAIAVAAAGVLAGRSVPAALLGLVAVGISWSYSMPPLRLLDTGWGEGAASLVVAAIVPLIGGFAQGAVPAAPLWWSVAILLPIHLAMMLAFELPDLETDRAAGKRVLAVRVGRRSTAGLITLLLVGASVVAALAGFGNGLPTVAMWGTAAGIPPALVMLMAIRRRQNGLLTVSAVATLVFVGVGLLVGLTR